MQATRSLATGCSHKITHSLLWTYFLFAGFILYALEPTWTLAQAQTAAPPHAAVQTADRTAPPNSTLAETPTFKVKVDLVQVRVVVRDSQGRAVGNLRKEDFELFDQKEQQVISRFSVEQPGKGTAGSAARPSGKPGEAPAAASAPAIPAGYIAYVVDDVHLVFEDLARVRAAVLRDLESRSPTERLAVFTTSGKSNVDFTQDRGKLKAALEKVLPQPVPGLNPQHCPPIGDAQAEYLMNRRDPDIIALTLKDWKACDNAPHREEELYGFLPQVLDSATQGSRVSLAVLNSAVRRMATVPGSGTRMILLVSPGFRDPRTESAYQATIERAVKAQVIISALNGHGLDAHVFDKNGHPLSLQETAAKVQIELADGNVLGELAHGTGGSYVYNDNGFEQALREISVPPDYVYVLGFKPSSLKPDGSFHELKVKLKNRSGLDIQARKGYYAPQNGPVRKKEDSRREVYDAILSQPAAPGLPATVGTEIAQSGAVQDNPAPAAPATPAVVPNAATSAAGTTASGKNAAQEMPTFKVKVDLVQVRVVARDAQGRAVGNLRKEDFEILDQRKPQTIREFNVERAAAGAPVGKAAPKSVPSAEAAAPGTSAPPERYLAYVFDDLHLAFGDLAQVRDAAIRNLQERSPGDRVAFITTSGEGNVDFTTDRARLEAALRQMTPRGRGPSAVRRCPEVTEYEAERIRENDANAIGIFNQELTLCKAKQVLNRYESALDASQEVLAVADHESRTSISVLERLIRRLAVLPGRREIVLLSPGFYSSQAQAGYEQLVELALRRQVTINALNARGVYTIDPNGDIATGLALPPQLVSQKADLLAVSAVADEGILAELAHGTGGTFFHNDNGYEEGLREILTPPEYVYQLSFSPSDLKPDGSFHELKVALKHRSGITLQARKGYYAPQNAPVNALADRTEESRRQMDEALFSQPAAPGLSAPAGTEAGGPGKPQDNPAAVVQTATVTLPSGATPAADSAASAKSVTEEVTTFKAEVNLVQVRAVVRDSHGLAVGNLRKEDFQVLDKNKRQTIRQFTVEQASKSAGTPPASAPATAAGASPGSAVSAVPPERYLAYVFDDLHLAFGDLAQVRAAALRNLAERGPGDRVALIATSGQQNVDFTSDHGRIEAALKQLHPAALGLTTRCPEIGPYQAEMILDRDDPNATNIAVQELNVCTPSSSRPSQPSGGRGGANSGSQSGGGNSGSQSNSGSTDQIAAKNQVRQIAEEVRSLTDYESQMALSALAGLVRRLAALPGQRAIVLISPGFYSTQAEYGYEKLVELALRAQVTISSLNARGVFTIDPNGDISSGAAALPPQIATLKTELLSTAAIADEGVLAELAHGTGGSFFHNDNGYSEGLHEIAAPPEYVYQLSFSPSELKPDGAFHELKLSLKNHAGLTIQARRGYYAPKDALPGSDEAKEDIDDAMFSRAEVHDLPVDLGTSFFKPQAGKTKLDVVAHVDVKHLSLLKVGERNTGKLTVVSGLFDRDGKFVAGLEKIVQMRIKDETLATGLDDGIIVKSTFDVDPGTYFVRLVARDSEGHIASVNGSVEIP